MREKVRNLLEQKGRDVWSVTPDSTVLDAIRLMAEKGIGAVLVIRGEELVGMLSERDYTRKVVLEQRSSATTRTAEIMTEKVLVVDPERTVEECMAIMTEKRIRHLPVIEHGRVVGIISIGDVVKQVIAARSFLISQLEQYITGA